MHLIYKPDIFTFLSTTNMIVTFRCALDKPRDNATQSNVYYTSIIRLLYGVYYKGSAGDLVTSSACFSTCVFRWRRRSV